MRCNSTLVPRVHRFVWLIAPGQSRNPEPSLVTAAPTLPHRFVDQLPSASAGSYDCQPTKAFHLHSNYKRLVAPGTTVESTVPSPATAHGP